MGKRQISKYIKDTDFHIFWSNSKGSGAWIFRIAALTGTCTNYRLFRWVTSVKITKKRWAHFNVNNVIMSNGTENQNWNPKTVIMSKSVTSNFLTCQGKMLHYCHWTVKKIWQNIKRRKLKVQIVLKALEPL